MNNKVKLVSAKELYKRYRRVYRGLTYDEMDEISNEEDIPCLITGKQLFNNGFYVISPRDLEQALEKHIGHRRRSIFKATLIIRNYLTYWRNKIMPKNINSLPKCKYVSTDNTLCRAPRLKDSMYCRHHAPMSYTKTAKKKRYKKEIRKISEALTADPNRYDVKVEIQLLRVLIAMLQDCYPDDMAAIKEVIMLLTCLRKCEETQAKIDMDVVDNQEIQHQINGLVWALKRSVSDEQIAGINQTVDEGMTGDLTKEIFKTACKKSKEELYEEICRYKRNL